MNTASNTNPTIAIFDSGIGGFTALAEAARLFPAENFLFYADTAHVPYGEKPLAQVQELTAAAVADILTYNVKAIIIACNTATSAAAQQLRARYAIPILGMEPAIKPALLGTSAEQRVLLLCTPLTAEGQKLSSLVEQVDSAGRVDCLPLPQLVTLAEQLDFDSPKLRQCLEQTVLSRDLSRYGAMVLGCTHFVWYRELLRQLLPAHIRLYDGNRGTLNYLRNILREQGSDPAAPGSGQRQIIAHFTAPISAAKQAALTDKLGEPLVIV